MPPESPGAARFQAGARDGAAGRLLPALAAKLLSEEGEPQSLADRGVLHLRGVSFPVSTEWTDMGQPARFDEDGFLYLG